MTPGQPLWPRFLPSAWVINIAMLGPVGRVRRGPGTAGSFAGLLYFTVLFAGLAAVFGWAWLCRLPRLWHPVFEVEGFERASIDRYFLAVDARDAHYVADVSMRRLAELGALRVQRVGDGPQEAAA